MLILALVFGINPGELMGGTSGSAGGSASGTDLTQCQTGADVAKDRNCRFVVYANTANAYWAGLLQGYQPVSYTHLDVYKRQLLRASGSGPVLPFALASVG